MCGEKIYFSTKFCYFYIDHIKSRFFLKQLPEHVKRGDGDVPKIFLFEFFTFSNMLKTFFK
jgi:hypothetical protein